MHERAEFTITELLLSALGLAGALVALIHAGKLYYDGEAAGALESSGLALMLLAASADPVHGLLDWLSFPWHIVEPSGDRTVTTTLASGLGIALSLLGWWMGR